MAQSPTSNFMGVIGISWSGDNVWIDADSLKLVIQIANVGDSKSMIISQWPTTANDLTAPEKAACGLREGLLRFSVGIEHIDDLKADFTQAFQAVVAEKPVIIAEGTVMLNTSEGDSLLAKGPIVTSTETSEVLVA